MKIVSLVNSYRNKQGRPRFVYEVDAKLAEVQSCLNIKQDEETKKLLMWSFDEHKPGDELLISRDGRKAYVPANLGEEVRAVDRMAHLLRACRKAGVPFHELLNSPVVQDDSATS